MDVETNEHADNTYVEVVEEPAFRAECRFCGWKGDLHYEYERAVKDGDDHAPGRR